MTRILYLIFYKQLIALRKNPEYKETVVYGTLEPVWENRHNLMAYYRKADKTLLVVGNYQAGRTDNLRFRLLVKSFDQQLPGCFYNW